MKLEVLNRILLTIVIALILAIGAVTATTFIVKKGKIDYNYRHSDPSPEKIRNEKKGNDKIDAFTNFSQIRITTKVEEEKQEGAIVVITPWLSYPSEDKQFFEELSQKERQMKVIFQNYFSSMTIKELKSKGEGQIKAELADQINQQLVLGKIRAVYFNDYIFIE